MGLLYLYLYLYLYYPPLNCLECSTILPCLVLYDGMRGLLSADDD